MEIKIISISKELPTYATEGSAGVDLKAYLSANINTQYFDKAAYDEVAKCIRIFPNGRALIPTGLYVAIPKGYEGQIRARSGLALKKGIQVLNAPGTIDSDYRGEIGIILHNTSESDFEVFEGDRVAQMVLAKTQKIEWKTVSALDSTDRDSKGFGSSGVK